MISVDRRDVARGLCLLGLLTLAAPAGAWVYPEHRDIAVLGVESLDPERRAAFDRLWKEARIGHEARLCEQGADAAQGTAPACIDWAAWLGISGDHSCSSKDMLGTVLESDWILSVADVAAQLKLDLARIPVVPPPDATPADAKDQSVIPDLRRRMQSEALRAQRLNALRTSDTRLQRADPGYATRAGASNAHFLLARPRADIDASAYGQLALTTGSEVNAVGVSTSGST